MALPMLRNADDELVLVVGVVEITFACIDLHAIAFLLCVDGSC